MIKVSSYLQALLLSVLLNNFNRKTILRKKLGMIIPDNTQVFEAELGTFWFDEHGILCAQAKNTARTLEKQKETYAYIKKITNNTKVCLLSDTTNTSSQDKEVRDYVAIEMPHIFHAMAVISSSKLGHFVTVIFLALKQQPIPIKFFHNEKDAKDWLKQFINPTNNEEEF